MSMTTMSVYSMDHIYNHRTLLMVNFWLYFYDNNKVHPLPFPFPTSFLGFHPWDKDILASDFQVFNLSSVYESTLSGVDLNVILSHFYQNI